MNSPAYPTFQSKYGSPQGNGLSSDTISLEGQAQTFNMETPQVQPELAENPINPWELIMNSQANVAPPDQAGQPHQYRGK